MYPSRPFTSLCIITRLSLPLRPSAVVYRRVTHNLFLFLFYWLPVGPVLKSLNLKRSVD